MFGYADPKKLREHHLGVLQLLFVHLYDLHRKELAVALAGTFADDSVSALPYHADRVVVAVETVEDEGWIRRLDDFVVVRELRRGFGGRLELWDEAGFGELASKVL